MDRRDFLNLTAAALGVAVAPSLAQQLQSPQPTATPQLRGVQLYTLRSLMAADVATTLAAVAEIGYRNVEFAGYFARTPVQLKRDLDAAGLNAPSAHIPLPQLRADFPRCLEAAQLLGHEYLVLPWLDTGERTLENFRQLADELNGWGEQARAAGIRMAYHNHDFEFAAQRSGPVPFELLLQRTEPELVDFEMDLYWVKKAGRDPLDYFRRYPQRFPLWHLKDMDRSGAFADLGSGTIDFEKIFAAAAGAGLRYGFVEHDHSPRPLRTLRNGYRAVQTLLHQV
ncbi:sugar phosphate isomerase/epimerase [Microbulbifer sp. SAOS-129_SWC]|uniref:sugar phosphate isomerase/epimerase family protein n=1 Tax=Microbulbifer sp. SAOS-129_SWC TaxID=3145235 RepID=UPI003217AB15